MWSTKFYFLLPFLWCLLTSSTLFSSPFLKFPSLRSSPPEATLLIGPIPGTANQFSCQHGTWISCLPYAHWGIITTDYVPSKRALHGGKTKGKWIPPWLVTLYCCLCNMMLNVSQDSGALACLKPQVGWASHELWMDAWLPLQHTELKTVSQPNDKSIKKKKAVWSSYTCMPFATCFVIKLCVSYICCV